MAMTRAIRRIVPWGEILGAINIKYVPRTAVKGQVLVDLVAEIAESLANEMTEAQHIDGKSVGTVLLHRTLFPNGYMLMVLKIKDDSKWG